VTYNVSRGALNSTHSPPNANRTTKLNVTLNTQLIIVACKFIRDMLFVLRQVAIVALPNPKFAVTHGQCNARPPVTFPAVDHHRPSTKTNLSCLVTE